LDYTFNKAEKILGTYSLEEIFEQNDKTEADVLYFLLQSEYLELPEILPIDI
jgi:hypothetical protein